jgi:DNA-binding NarL/FixJ family response regulator
MRYSGLDRRTGLEGSGADSNKQETYVYSPMPSEQDPAIVIRRDRTPDISSDVRPAGSRMRGRVEDMAGSALITAPGRSVRPMAGAPVSSQVKVRPQAPAERPGSEPATVGIVVKEALTRAGMRSILDAGAGMTVIGDAYDAHSMIDLVLRSRPNVLVVDVSIPDSDMVSAVAMLRRKIPQTRVVALAAVVTDELVFRALSAGVTGFLLKDCDPAELAGSVRAAVAGDAVLTPCVARRLINRFAGFDVERAKKSRALVDSLTEREREVLAHLAGGLANLKIARELYMSEGAVKAHISRLLTKMGCSNRVEAAIVFHHAVSSH